MKNYCLKLIGLSEEEATNLLKEDNLSCRITYRDGKYFIVTRDYRLDRINIKVENGYVIQADVG